jgi:hypothetical protein
VRDALAANLDVWAPEGTQGRYNTDRPSLGQQGWALAVFTGCQDVELTQRQLGLLLCLGDKQASRLVAKLKKVGFAMTYKRGRQVIVQLEFGTNLVEILELAEDLVAAADRARVKTEKHLLRRNGPSLAEKMANREIWMHSKEDLEELSPEVREFIESARTSMRVRKEVIRGYERVLENSERVLRAEVQKAADKGAQEPAEAPVKVLTSEERQAQYEACRDLLRRHGLVS